MTPALQKRLISSMEKSGCRPIIVASHPRSGTHLMLDALRLNFRECRSRKRTGQMTDKLYLQAEPLIYEMAGIAAAERLVQRVQRPVMKCHFWPDFSHFDAPDQPAPFWRDLRTWLLAHATIIYMVRDGRAAISSHRLLTPKREIPESLGEFLRQPAGGRENRAAAWAAHVRAWRAAQGALVVRMEELKAEPETILRALGRQLNLTPRLVSPRLPTLRQPFFGSTLLRGFKWSVESTAYFGGWKHGRRPHDWRVSMDAADREFFHRHGGDVLIEEGYESSDGWFGAEDSISAKVNGSLQTSGLGLNHSSSDGVSRLATSNAR